VRPCCRSRASRSRPDAPHVDLTACSRHPLEPIGCGQTRFGQGSGRAGGTAQVESSLAGRCGGPFAFLLDLVKELLDLAELLFPAALGERVAFELFVNLQALPENAQVPGQGIIPGANDEALVLLVERPGTVEQVDELLACSGASYC
jgi:hypothetical protein